METRQIAVVVLLGALAVACSGVSGKSTKDDTSDQPAAQTTGSATPASPITEVPPAPATTDAPAKATTTDAAAAPNDTSTPPKGAGNGDDDDEPALVACCAGSLYFLCPNADACNGAPDFTACKTCGDDNACFDACVQKLLAAGAVPEGCVKAQPPQGFACLRPGNGG